MRALLNAFILCTALGTYGPAAHAHGSGHGAAVGCPGETSHGDHHGKQARDLACCCMGMCLGTVLVVPGATFVPEEAGHPLHPVAVDMDGFVLRPPKPPPKA